MTTARTPRNPWPIAIIAYFLVFGTGLVTFIVYATRQPVDLVRDDYYEEEIRYQQQLDRIQRTREMGQPAAIAYDSRQQCIMIKLPAAHAGPSSGRIHLYRPSDARLDQELPLAISAEGAQRLDASKLRSGLWKVRVEWTIGGEEYFFDQPVVLPPHRGSSS